MKISVRLRLIAIPFAAAAITVGCGQGSALQSTTGPTGTAGSISFLTPGDTDVAAAASADVTSELLAKGGNGKGAGRGDKEDKGNDEADSANQARIVGFVSAHSGSALTVEGTSIVAGAHAVIRHGNRTLTMADIEIGDHIQARGAMEGATLVAEEIKVQDTGNDHEETAGASKVEGTISGLSAVSGCPVVTFMIGATKVTTSAATTFDDVTCATLANNALVDVKGIRQLDGSILATKVEAEAGPDELTGTVFEFSGAASCPAATFKVGPVLSLATRVTTTATTTLTGVTCAALANGARVEIEGTKQADGSITAASVELK